jgi:hypothetical protein
VKRLISFVLLVTIVLLFFLVTGCSRPQTEPHISGLIFTVNENRILVVADIDDVDIPEEEWFDIGKRAIWFSIDKKTKIEYTDGKRATPIDLKEGQAVFAWADGGTMKSYPEQATAQKIVIIAEVK